MDLEDMTYYHGSMDHLEVGTVLVPDKDYEKNWGRNGFYKALKHYRPKHMLGHDQVVFMVTDEDDVDNAGGGTEWLFVVKPLGPVTRHDMNWCGEICLLLEEDEMEDEIEEKIKQAADNYWNGVAHPGESMWEYLTPKAEILSVERF